ncbi:hypothetical protein M9435_003370 [Picochlorum sp. BPE23]|nr:hypothetical protein M9435_003370 [Picochlorum sp. BPE23]
MKRSLVSRCLCLGLSGSRSSPGYRGLQYDGLPSSAHVIDSISSNRWISFVSGGHSIHTVEPRHGKGYSSTSLSSMLQKEMDRFRQYVQKDTGIQSLSDVFYNEMMQKEPGDEDEVPIRAGDFLYTVVLENGFPSIYRASAISGSVEPELVLRTEDIAKQSGSNALHIEALRISRCGGCILLVVHVCGVDSREDIRRVYIRDISKKKTIHQPHMTGAMNAEYDKHGMVYLTLPDALGIPSRVYRTRPAMCPSDGTEMNRLELVYEDMDPQNFVGIQRTKDWEYVCINSNSKTSSEVHLVYDDGELLRVKERIKGIEYFVEHAHGHLVVSSNHRHGVEHEIFVSKLSEDAEGILHAGEWALVYSPDPKSSVSDMMVNRNAITLLERVFPGIPRVRVLTIDMHGDAMVAQEPYTVPLPDWAIDTRFGPNENYATDKIQFELQSPILPPVQVEWDVLGKQLYSSSAQEHVMQEYQQILDNYSVTRVALNTSDENVSIPLTIAYKHDATNPSKCLFISYAAYGENVDMSYQSYLFPLMDRGWKIMFIHARGGGELGCAWHHAGRVPFKANSEKDIISAITTMVHEGIALPGHVAAMTHSAGAIPICSALNKKPGLVNALVMDSPFVDVFGAMSNPDHALTEHEYEEFGNPDRDNVKAICPTSGIQHHEYPHMLIATGRQDHQHSMATCPRTMKN